MTSQKTANKCEGYILTFIFLPIFCLSKTKLSNSDISKVSKQSTKPTKQKIPKQFKTWLLSSSAFPALKKKKRRMQMGLSVSAFENISFVNHFDVVYLLQHRILTVLKSTSDQFSQSRLWFKPQKLPCLI